MEALVTPFAGVWIEIAGAKNAGWSIQSLPSRECGLKFPIADMRETGKWSLPSRECGLKF